MAVRVISVNVRGLGNCEKRRAIFNYYRKRCDILCIQETYCTKDSEQQWRNEWGGKIFFSNGESDSRGTAICINPKQDINVHDCATDNESRVLLLNCTIGDFSFSICTIYAPNNDNPNFYIKLLEVLHLANENLVLVGDFNLVLDPELDSKNTNHNNVKATQVLQNIIDKLSLMDIWRIRNPNQRRYSYFRHRPKVQARRIDFALISTGISDFVDDIFYLPGLLSDHSALAVLIKYSENSRGRGY